MTVPVGFLTSMGRKPTGFTDSPDIVPINYIVLRNGHSRSTEYILRICR